MSLQDRLPHPGLLVASWILVQQPPHLWAIAIVLTLRCHVLILLHLHLKACVRCPLVQDHQVNVQPLDPCQGLALRREALLASVLLLKYSPSTPASILALPHRQTPAHLPALSTPHRKIPYRADTLHARKHPTVILIWHVLQESTLLHRRDRAQGLLRTAAAALRHLRLLQPPRNLQPLSNLSRLDPRLSKRWVCLSTSKSRSVS